MLEGLIIISNKFGNHDRQAMFLAEILNPVLDQFRSLETSYSDPAKFMDYVGLTSAPVPLEKMSEDAGDLHNDTSEEYLRNITEFIEANLGNQSHQTK